MTGLGAALAFRSGSKRQVPRWIQSTGFEWLFFFSEPRRLSYHQCPLFMLKVQCPLASLLKYPLED